MSIFSRMRFARKVAEEQKAKNSQQTKPEDAPKVIYKHVPTHAAIDALNGAPSSWKAEDKSKILEHHKRRTMMLSRTGSQISTKTWNEQGSTPPVAPYLPRAGSYNGYASSWDNNRGEHSYLNEPYHKRKRPSRNTSFIDSGIGPSPLASEVASEHVSPSGSSNSSLTDDNLEIHPQKRSQQSTFAHRDTLERLHTGSGRKLGEAPLLSSPLTLSRLTSAPVEVEEKKKRRWTLKGKSREIGLAA